MFTMRNLDVNSTAMTVISTNSEKSWNCEAGGKRGAENLFYRNDTNDSPRATALTAAIKSRTIRLLKT